MSQTGHYPSGTADLPVRARGYVEYFLAEGLELTRERWDRIAGILQDMSEAAAAVDPKRLEKAARELMRLSSHRIFISDGSRTTSAGPDFFERANRTIDALSAMRAALLASSGQDAAGQDAAGQDGDAAGSGR